MFSLCAESSCSPTSLWGSPRPRSRRCCCRGCSQRPRSWPRWWFCQSRSSFLEVVALKSTPRRQVSTRFFEGHDLAAQDHVAKASEGLLKVAAAADHKTSYLKLITMLLMRKCCCLDLRTGCITVAFFRLLLWVVVLSAAVYTCLHVFSADDKGLFHYRARINIEENGM